VPYELADGATLQALGRILGTDVTDLAALQASLPLRAGGLGLRPMAETAAALRQDSWDAWHEWVIERFDRAVLAAEPEEMPQALLPPEPRPQGSESRAEALDAQRTAKWLASAPPELQEHVLDVHHAGAVGAAWLLAPPTAQYTIPHFREALCYRLGLEAIPQARVGHPCPQHGIPAGPRGHHEAGCFRAGGGVNARHNALRDVTLSALARAHVPAVREQSIRQLAQAVGNVPDQSVAAAETRYRAGRRTAPTQIPRPCDIVIPRWAKPAVAGSLSGTACTMALDVVVTTPQCGLARQTGAGSAAAPVAAAVASAGKHAEAAEAVRMVGAAYGALAFSTNGGLGEDTASFVRELARRWAITSALPESVARQLLARELSVERLRSRLGTLGPRLRRKQLH